MGKRGRKQQAREAQEKAQRKKAGRQEWWASLSWTQQQEYIARKVIARNAARTSDEAHGGADSPGDERPR